MACTPCQIGQDGFLVRVVVCVCRSYVVVEGYGRSGMHIALVGTSKKAERRQCEKSRHPPRCRCKRIQTRIMETYMMLANKTDVYKISPAMSRCHHTSYFEANFRPVALLHLSQDRCISSPGCKLIRTSHPASNVSTRCCQRIVVDWTRRASMYAQVLVRQRGDCLPCQRRDPAVCGHELGKATCQIFIIGHNRKVRYHMIEYVYARVAVKLCSTSNRLRWQEGFLESRACIHLLKS